MIRAIKAGDWTANPDGTVEAAGITLLEGEFTEKVVAADPTGTVALPGNTGLVVLDTVVTPELAREGLARDLVRLVQQARRDAGLAVADRIALILDAPEAVVDAVRRARDVRRGGGAGDVGAVRPGAGPDLAGHGLGRPRGARPRPPGRPLSRRPVARVLRSGTRVLRSGTRVLRPGTRVLRSSTRGLRSGTRVLRPRTAKCAFRFGELRG